MTRTHFDGIVVAVFLICLNSRISVAQNWPNLLQSAQSSVVELLATGPNVDGTNSNNIPSSGYVVHSSDVTKQTYIITAAHVLNPPSGWADKAVGGGPDRTVRVRIQRTNDQFDTLATNAVVIDENIDRDFAILAIPQQPIAGLAVSSSSQLRVGTPLLIAGFPQNMKYAGRPLNIWSTDLPRSRIVLDGVAEPGQSGGAVIDSAGRAVALISENDNRQNPRYHTAVIVSEPLDSLNDFLRKKGLPAVVLEDASPSSSRFRVTERVGLARVVLSGDSGDLASGIERETSLDKTTEVTASATGNEQSDCAPEFGRWTSSASGFVSIQPFELAGLRVTLKAIANGGHSTKSLSCLSKSPVGFAGVDTNAAANINAEGEIAFETKVVPFDLRISWRELPQNSDLKLFNPSSQIESEIDPSVMGDKTVRIEVAGKWRLKIRINLEARAVGAFAVATASQPLVFLETR
jgi:hypothetical protein